MNELEGKIGNQYILISHNKNNGDDKKLEDELRRIARQSAQSEIGKKPEVTVVISRLS